MAKENALIRQKFGDRDLDSLTERGLRQMYREVPFDLNLVASNDEKIPVHYFAMILFSSYLRNKFKDELIFKPNIDGKFENKMRSLFFFSMVDLFFNGFNSDSIQFRSRNFHPKY